MTEAYESREEKIRALKELIMDAANKLVSAIDDDEPDVVRALASDFAQKLQSLSSPLDERDEVQELLDTWGKMVGSMNAASAHSIGIGKDAWAELIDVKKEYGTSHAARDAARSFAVGVNAWRDAASHWSTFADPDEG